MSSQYKLKKRHYEHDRLKNIDVNKLYDPDEISFSLVLQLVNVCFEKVEKMFISIFRELLEHVDDPDLIEQMKTFIYQEANHTLLHRGYCNRLRQGLSPLVNIMFSACDNYNCIAKESMDKSGLLQDKLYFVIIHEIFASKFSEYFLNHYKDKHRQLDPYAGYIYMVHSIEEIEHQCLAFDLYVHLFKEHPHARKENLNEFKKFNKNIVKRFAIWAVQATQAWHTEKNLPVPNAFEITNEITGDNGLFPHGELCIEYYQPDFHPSKMNMRHLIDRWESEWESDLLQRMK